MSTFNEYGLIDADGHFGDTTRIYSTHKRLQTAVKAASRWNRTGTSRVQIIRAQWLRKGWTIHRGSLGHVYQRVNG